MVTYVVHQAHDPEANHLLLFSTHRHCMPRASNRVCASQTAQRPRPALAAQPARAAAASERTQCRTPLHRAADTRIALHPHPTHPCRRGPVATRGCRSCATRPRAAAARVAPGRAAGTGAGAACAVACCGARRQKGLPHAGAAAPYARTHPFFTWAHTCCVTTRDGLTHSPPVKFTDSPR